MNEAETKNEIVKIVNKTGSYIGKAIEQDERRVLVEVLAVLQHPTQGDLHSSYDPDAAMFHERRALAYHEKVWAPIQSVQRYTGAVPEYRESLKTALELEAARMDRMKRWAERCLDNLETLRKDYGM
ncbi:sporulation phosphorelay system protein KapB [Cohnella terricola]|uniref:Kinase n=1 Tax=Cohnella terricola TaxID=1289167 RepID=A0A559JMP9_9BACL|nr:sporulation phosphorelay system protein KapB [Cohnella terricola]TVY01140.1 kinase [Cohnella terricola]